MPSVVETDWFETATGHIDELFDNATYVVDDDLETYVLTPRGWQSFGVLGSPDFFSRTDFWDRWITLAARLRQEENGVFGPNRQFSALRKAPVPHRSPTTTNQTLTSIN